MHRFDCVTLLRRTFNQGHTLQYDAAAANDGYIRVKAFLDRYVGHPAN